MSISHIATDFDGRKRRFLCYDNRKSSATRGKRMPAAKKASATKATRTSGSPADMLAALLLDRAPPEDLAAYGDDALHRAAELAYAAL